MSGHRAFVIGAAGWIGSAVATRLVRDGFDVVGIVRSATDADAVERTGATPLVLDIANADAFAKEIRSADHVLYAASAEASVGLNALRVASASVARRGGSLLFVSGSAIYVETGAETAVPEDAAPTASSPSFLIAAEGTVLETGATGGRGIVLRGAGVLYGRGGGSTAQFLTADARQRGAAAFIGEGAQRWSAVHVDDLAALAALTIQRQARGVFNAVSDSATLRSLAQAIARWLMLESTCSLTLAQSRRAWGPGWSRMLGTSLFVSNERALSLGWRPEHRQLLEEPGFEFVGASTRESKLDPIAPRQKSKGS